MRFSLCTTCAAIALLSACRGAPSPAPSRATNAPEETHRRLPTGLRLDPAGTSVPVGQMPLAMQLSPDGRRVVLLLNGWREHGVEVVDRATGRDVQRVPLAAAFIGLAFAPDGRSLYASGGNDDVVYRFAWRDGALSTGDTLRLAPKPPSKNGTRYPAGLALSRDGRRLYVAENLADSLAVIDVASGRVLQRFATERYPYGVTVAPDGTVYVSAWGGNTVSVFTERSDGTLLDAGRITAARHPSALLLNADGSRLFVASASTDRVVVIDTRSRAVTARLLDPPPAGPGEGSTPNALALSADGTRLFAAEADANAVAIFDLSVRTAGVTRARGDDRLAGRIPVGWYPAGVIASGDTLLVANGKGEGTAPNPHGPVPGVRATERPLDYTLGQLTGTLTTIPGGATLTGEPLALHTRRVMQLNGWERGEREPATYPPIRHVVYVIKENRTYDEVLGDLSPADGDTALLFFPRAVAPNHHALAERFGIFDRFFVNAEVSADGHNWSTAAYGTDYLEKTVPTEYSEHGGRPYDYEGVNRDEENTSDDVNEPANGYLWNLAERAGISFRNYGEFVLEDSTMHPDELPAGYRGTKPYLAAHTDPRYPGWNLDIRDQVRANEWIRELREFERSGEMPQLELVRLPNDHTSGVTPGKPTPFASFADNDLALGRMVEALSRSRFWASTVMFVLEDDAQNGPDHVDSHRSPLLVISPYGRAGVIHRFANTTDVIATIAELLHLGSLSQYDFYGRPLRGIFAATADLSPYAALRPSVSLDDRNPAAGKAARRWGALDLRLEDRVDDDAFNRMLWAAIKGEHVPYPGPTRMSALEPHRAH